MPAGKPSLELHAEVTLADGSRYRWDAGAHSAGDRPQGISFGTKRGDGFGDAQLALSRRIDRDWVDLNLFDDFALVGADGSIAYEGRVAANPRSLGEQGHQMSVVLAGWMTHAKDRAFQEIYVDRDLSAWGEMPLNERVRQAARPFDTKWFTWTTAPDGLVVAVINQPAPVSVENSTWYTAPPGVKLGKVMYKGKETTIPGTWQGPLLLLSVNDLFEVGTESLALTLDDTLRTASSANKLSRYAWFTLTTGGAASVTPAAGTNRRISTVGVYGNHGLTTRSIDSSTPDGLFASDVLADIVSRFCPKLSTAGIQATTYAIPHLVFKDRTLPYDAILAINKFHLWDIGVWENKTFTFRPFDLTDYDWEVRLSDPGVTVELQGDSTDQLANGIVVSYIDVATGRLEVLTPDTTPSLQDTNPNNPATQHGITAWTEITLTDPTTAVAAAQIGVIALAEYNQPKGPGTIHVTGHVRDRAGHWQQGWKVREGDTIAITDHPNDRPRLVYETRWDHDALQLTISVDSTAQRLDAILDRQSTALQAANLT